LIDLHCHFLPGIDDGAKNIDEAIALAKFAYESGITHVVCTPHIHEGFFDNDIDIIARAHDEFRTALLQENIPLKSHFSAEVRISPNIVALAKAKRLPFLGYFEGKPVLLLELPHSHIPPGTEQLIQWLKQNDILPMIAHPERNRDIIAKYSKARWLKGQGVLFQITAGAITGTFGEKVQRCALTMLNDGLVDIVATDAHNLRKRPPELSTAFAILVEKYGSHCAEQWCVNTPKDIVSCWFDDK